MPDVYIIQVLAQHGYGLEGWRTVRNATGEPYSFTTPEAAQAALQRHFATMREGLNVRVQCLDAAALQRLRPVAPPDPTSSSVPAPRRPPAGPCP